MKKTRWKFLREGLMSNFGDKKWELDKWEREDKINMCNSGFHCSKEINQAFIFVQGEILAEVEVKGKCDKQDNKEVYTDMRILKAYKWQKKDSVALSIYAAELCLKNFEKVFPDDKRPREAIEAAKKWLAEPTSANESARSAWSTAEWSAWAAWSAAESVARSAARSTAESAARSTAESAAESARSAVRSAAWSAWSTAEWSAWSARSAAESARSAARSAAWSAWSTAEWSAWAAAAWSAWSARSAAESARSAAESARSAAESAWSALTGKIEVWFLKRLKELEKYEK